MYEKVRKSMKKYKNMSKGAKAVESKCEKQRKPTANDVKVEKVQISMKNYEKYEKL